jgi:hypothetical protein
METETDDTEPCWLGDKNDVGGGAMLS